jgi:hypothetical protein
MEKLVHFLVENLKKWLNQRRPTRGSRNSFLRPFLTLKLTISEENQQNQLNHP